MGTVRRLDRELLAGHAVPRAVFVRAVMRSDLPPTTRLVLLVLAAHAKADGSDCFPTVDAVRVATGLCARQLERDLSRARKGGWVGSTGRAGRANIWHLRLPDSSRAAATPRSSVAVDNGAGGRLTVAP